ncbi:MAG: glycosyltransferase family 2 protein [Beijerinckiaceae bacterium]
MIVALPVAILLFETTAVIALPSRSTTSAFGKKFHGRVTVLIPAHNEEDGLPATIANVQPQLRYGDRILVVADNCSDNTARVAKELGAEVIVRLDPVNKGKGFALDFGVRHLSGNPPAIVIVLDADCTLEELAIDSLAATCNATNRPAQARYVMVAAPDPSPSSRVREFSWRVKNWIRPLGLHSAGLPCQLMGTGMAFPWDTIARANLATAALAEDLKLGLELAADGHPPVFCPLATVTSEFPISDEGSRSQQRRWEQGHLGVIGTAVPRFLVSGIWRGDLNLVVLTLDAAVPPLSLLWMMILFTLAISLGSWWTGAGPAAFLVTLCSFSGFIIAALVCWLVGGRDLLPFQELLLIAMRTITKLPLYMRIFFLRGAQKWIRTDRRKL